MYDSGNNEPMRGFGHVAIFTNDVYHACEQLETKGVCQHVSTCLQSGCWRPDVAACAR